MVDLPEQQSSAWNVGNKICNLTIGGGEGYIYFRPNKFPGPDYEAVERVMDQFNNGSRVCPCEPSCVEEVYTASVSSMTWPSNKYKVVHLFKKYDVAVSDLLCQLSKSNKYKVIVNLSFKLPRKPQLSLMELTRRVCLKT